MAPLALALHLALAVTDPVAPPPPPPAADVVTPATATGAAPGLAAVGEPGLASIRLPPRQLDHGPFRVGEVAGATLGAFAGDALVIGSGLLALRLFADGRISPSATNFRRAVYVLGVSALVVPPLTAVLLARLTGGPHARGGFWKALLLASAGQAAALGAGYLASPHFWVVLPVQAVALSLGASLGLHWGAHPRAAAGPAMPDPRREPPEPRPGATAALATPICADA